MCFSFIASVFSFLWSGGKQLGEAAAREVCSHCFQSINVFL